MSWPVCFDPRRISLHVVGRIGAEDAERQERTVREVLKRLERQPGVVLADEVGMGKTFVALAVAASVAWSDKRRRPVVIMVPPSLRDKWPVDFETFRERCVKHEEDRAAERLRTGVASNGVEFFRLLNDPVERRCHLIFLTHGALYGALNDPWVKLAILQRALMPRRFEAQRRALPRFAGRIVRCAARFRDELFKNLLHSSVRRWRAVLEKCGHDFGDDPVPEAIARVLKRNRVDLKELRQGLCDLPLRASVHIDKRIVEVRRLVNEAIQGVWQQALVEARLYSPLLVLDEAHHLKNPATRLASLFVEPEAKEDAKLLDGALSGAFERMLFLTATPFQLGHHELLNVLDRFRGVRWQPGNPRMSRDDFDRDRKRLSGTLQRSYDFAARLDRHWGRLGSHELEGIRLSETALETWWTSVLEQTSERPEREQLVARAYERVREAMRESESALRPWVIRHLRPRRFVGTEALRRELLRGAAIESENAEQTNPPGIAVRDEALLPFLLAARSQAVVARGPVAAADRSLRRATFAEGLASSYEAFLETRAATLGGDGAEPCADEDSDENNAVRAISSKSPLGWYLGKLKRALPAGEAYARHPKLELTVRRACDLWEAGEKVLVFCHYRATGTALAEHVSVTLAQRIRRRASVALRCREDEVGRRFELLSERFDPDRPLYVALKDLTHELLAVHSGLGHEQASQIFEIVRRFVRTPSFLVRYFPLEATDTNRAFGEAMRKTDDSGLSLVQKLEGFVKFLVKRCEPAVRDRFIQALRAIQTGIRYGGKRPGARAEQGIELQPSVRRATGADGDEERRRSLLGFNTPFFPEILVASSVLAEGVDLHLNCRHVIHHDLCWNPSTLEQRTGRVDRIGAKAEHVRKPIRVFLPYIAETQDEKMYRVVRDRERWFQVMMGEKYVVDENVTDKSMRRIPLPESAAAQLVFRLEVQPSQRR